MNIHPNDVIVFESLAAGYPSLAVGKVSEYMHSSHLEVDNHTVIYHRGAKPNKEMSCSHRVGYNDIKKVVSEKYMDTPFKVLEDYPELLI